jgi:fumarate reductase subunit D
MALFTLDSLFNAMFNPLIILLAGSITSLWLNQAADLGESDTMQGNFLAQDLGTYPTRLF